MVRRLTQSAFLLAALALIALVSPLAAERADDAKRKSKNGLAEGTIDGVEISIAYGRPNVKGRDVWGGLVSYGKVWRTGADEATTISFSSDVTIEGKALAAGSYGLFTVPGEESWEIVFNKVANQWGAFKYDAGEDALRVTVTPAESDFVESLSFGIGDGHVGLHWADLGVAFEVTAAAD
jgi:hypothetical protein